MKKLLSCLLAFCMLFSLGIYNTYVTTTQIMLMYGKEASNRKQ